MDLLMNKSGPCRTLLNAAIDVGVEVSAKMQHTQQMLPLFMVLSSSYDVNNVDPLQGMYSSSEVSIS